MRRSRLKAQQSSPSRRPGLAPYATGLPANLLAGSEGNGIHHPGAKKI